MFLRSVNYRLLVFVDINESVDVIQTHCQAVYVHHLIQNCLVLSPSTEMTQFTSFFFTVQKPSHHYFRLRASFFRPISFIEASICFFQVAVDLPLFLLPITSKARIFPFFAKFVHTILQLLLLPFFNG